MPAKASTFEEKRVTQWVAEHYGLDVDATRNLGSFEDQNFRIRAGDGMDYLFKIHHTGTDEPTIDLQNQVVAHLAENVSALEFPQVIPDRDGRLTGVITDEVGIQYFTRLLTYLPGQLMNDIQQPGCRAADLARQISGDNRLGVGRVHPSWRSPTRPPMGLAERTPRQGAPALRW